MYHLVNMNLLFSLACFSVALASPADWRVVGGRNADPGEFPFIISLKSVTGSHRCGGSLINAQWAVTAAHCVIGQTAAFLSVAAGINRLNETGTRSRVSLFLLHAQYDANTIVNDVALLRLSTPLQETNLIRYIALDVANDPSLDVDVLLAGWGTLSYRGEIPNDLQTLQSRTVPHQTCLSNLGAVDDQLPITTSQVCAYTTSGEGACHGDSGGPLLTRTASGDTLIGIVSWGEPCALGYPDVYTRVAAYIDWINQRVL